MKIKKNQRGHQRQDIPFRFNIYMRMLCNASYCRE